jgi:NAD(P)H-flavin reductase
MISPREAVYSSGCPVPYRVVERTAEAPDVATMVLEPVAAALPPFAAGQFAMVYAFGVGDIPVSVCGIDGDRLSHTIRAVGAISGALQRVRPGQVIGVRGPFGAGWQLADAVGRDVLVIAGGIGLAPLRPLILAVLAEPAMYRRINILIGARSPRDLLYNGQLSMWQAAGAQTLTTVDVPGVDWNGDVGVVTTLLTRLSFTAREAVAFICGPEVMMRATARELEHRGLEPDLIYVSLERNMHCGTGHCGHCQLGPLLLCRDGPVVPWSLAQSLLAVREL